MGIKAIDGTGVNRANVICDECGRSEVQTCDYHRQANGEWVPNEGQIKKKIASHKWGVIKGKFTCPSCVAKRKMENMEKTKIKAVPDAPRSPTPKQRIAIFAMLAEVYDLDAQRYTGGDTDDTVADVLGVMPGWVAQIREAEFGPAGNEDIAALMAEMSEWKDKADASLGEAIRAVDACKADFAKVGEYKDRLAKIEKAVGQRIMSRVK